MSHGGRAREAVWEVLASVGIDPKTPVPNWERDDSGKMVSTDLADALAAVVEMAYADWIRLGAEVESKRTPKPAGMDEEKWKRIERMREGLNC